MCFQDMGEKKQSFSVQKALLNLSHSTDMMQVFFFVSISKFISFFQFIVLTYILMY